MIGSKTEELRTIVSPFVVKMFSNSFVSADGALPRIEDLKSLRVMDMLLGGFEVRIVKFLRLKFPLLIIS